MKKIRKYMFTGDTLQDGSIMLHRIRALIDIPSQGVRHGDIGGWIESEENLPHDCDAWVFDYAQVRGNAKMLNRSRASGTARVSKNARMLFNACAQENARICGNACLYGNAVARGNAALYDDARVGGNTCVCGNASVGGNAAVTGNAVVSGNAVIAGDAVVCGDTVVSGDAVIRNRDDYITVGPIGSRNAIMTFCRGKDGAIIVTCGCFTGTINELEKYIDLAYGDNRHGKSYRAAIELARIQLGR